MEESRLAFAEKMKESLVSVLPIVAIVMILCLTISPIQTDLMLCFLLGGAARDLRYGNVFPGGGYLHDAYRK